MGKCVHRNIGSKLDSLISKVPQSVYVCFSTLVGFKNLHPILDCCRGRIQKSLYPRKVTSNEMIRILKLPHTGNNVNVCTKSIKQSLLNGYPWQP